MASLQNRVIGALRLQPATYEEVEHDASATSQAATVVAAGAVSAAIGSYGASGFGVAGVVLTVVVSLIGWAIASAVLWLVGTRLFPGKNTEADYGQLLRVVGFAQSPSLFMLLRAIPFLGGLAWLVLSLWQIVAMVIGVRQALDYEDTMKAVIVCLVAWAVMFLTVLVVGLMGFGAAMSASFMQ